MRILGAFERAQKHLSTVSGSRDRSCQMCTTTVTNVTHTAAYGTSTIYHDPINPYMVRIPLHGALSLTLTLPPPAVIVVDGTR